MDDEKRELLKLSEHGQIIDVLDTIISSLAQEAEVLQNLDIPDQKDNAQILERLHERNDKYSHLIHNLLLDFIFLPVDKHSLQLVYESVSILIDGLQRITERVGMDEPELPIWAIDLYKSQLQVLVSLLLAMKQWFSVKNPAKIDLGEIHDLENEGDIIYRRGIAKILSEDMSIAKRLHADFILNKLEDCVDYANTLATRLFVVLQQYQVSRKKPPSYLA